MEQKTLILPLDGSDSSLAAMIPAISLAVQLNMIINIVYISEEEFSSERLILKLKLSRDIIPRFIITHKQGNPAEIILEASKQANFIVMATHGETRDLSKEFGSITEEIIKNSEIPVLLIRPDISITVFNDLWIPQKILIPLNGTPGAAQALDPVIDIVAKTESNINLLHVSVVDKERSIIPGCLTTPYYVDFPQYEWPSWSKEFIRRFSSKISRENNHAKISLALSEGDPGERIIEFIYAHDNDLVAMAWHGELGPLHAGILRKVILEAPCPVLLIKINHR